MIDETIGWDAKSNRLKQSRDGLLRVDDEAPYEILDIIIPGNQNNIYTW